MNDASMRPPGIDAADLPIQLNDDIGERVVVDSQSIPWVPSPMPGVSRRMLARSGGEAALATSIVRYEPGSRFSRHAHPFGEEIFVLDGVLEDEGGQYPAGTYLKNSPGSEHAPSSAHGCTLFVKLRHLGSSDGTCVVVRPSERDWHAGLVAGLQVAGLDSAGGSHTALVRWRAGTRFNRHWHQGGEEILVIDGTFEDEHGAYPAGTWMRSPHMSTHQPFSTQGCLILVKVGHLHTRLG